MKLRSLFLLVISLQYIVICKAQSGTVHRVSGDSVMWNIGFSGDGGPALDALLYYPFILQVDSTANLYINDNFNYRIRKIGFDNNFINTVVGGAPNFGNDGELAINTNLMLNTPFCVDRNGNIYYYDIIWIRKVDAVTGILTTIAGGGISLDDSISALNADIGGISGDFKHMYCDPFGNIYISFQGSIRKIDAITKKIYTVAGNNNGITGNSGNGGAATSALIDAVKIVVNCAGDIYFVQSDGLTIRKIDAQTGLISVVAGNGSMGYSGDGGSALNAQLSSARSVALDFNGNILIADSIGEAIRRVDRLTGVIERIAGLGSSLADGETALNTYMSVMDLCTDNYGNIFYTEPSHIRRINGDSTFLNIPIESFSLVSVNGSCSQPTIFKFGTPYYSLDHTIYTDFGDGYSAIDPILPNPGGGLCVVEHPYDGSGTYTVKHVLYHNAIAIDSIQYSYTYSMCRTIEGVLYIDNNANCIYDTLTEVSTTQPVLIAVDSNGVTIDTLSVTSGYTFDVHGQVGDVYSFSVINMPAGLELFCPVNGIISTTLQTQIYDILPLELGFKCSSVSDFDLAINAHVTAAANGASVDIVADNYFCTPQNALLTMTFSPEYVFQSSFPLPISQTSNSVTWNINPLTALISNPAYIHASLSPASQIVQPGDTVHTSFTINPLTGDIYPANNTLLLVDTVTGPYDPNAVYVSPSGCVVPGTRLQYTVTFENLGNAPAENIYIMDTLSAGFEMQSMKLLAVSHLMNVTKVSSGGYNILKFEFPNINLPDSSSPDRHGMVMYTIDMEDNFPIGSSVTNKAGIFFDYMPAVLTNVATTTACWPANVNEVVFGEDKILIYPNPATDELTIKTEKQFISYTITNSIGQVMMQQDMDSKESRVNIRSLATGIYYISLKGEQGSEVRKFVRL